MSNVCVSERWRNNGVTHKTHKVHEEGDNTHSVVVNRHHPKDPRSYSHDGIVNYFGRFRRFLRAHCLAHRLMPLITLIMLEDG